MVADAVRVEPVSAAKFPTTGKLIGNFAEKRALPADYDAFSAILSMC
jgi:hypothetical protein